MIKVRSFRFGTFLALLGAGALTMLQGVNLLSAAMGDATSGVFATAQLRAEATRRIRAPEDVQSRIDATEALLAVAPLDSRQWYRLAELRLRTGEAIDKWVSALAMSYITGPQESEIMWLRALLGWRTWAFLPIDAQRSTVYDFSGVWPVMTPDERKQWKLICDAAGESQRKEFRTILVGLDVNGTAIAKAVGLDVELPPPEAPAIDDEPEKPDP